MRTSKAAIGTPEYFEQIHRDAHDPFGLYDRWYERRKRQITLAMLPRARYRRALEPGCSAAAVTVELAKRCDSVLSLDISPSAVRTARSELSVAGLSNVDVEVGTVPDDWPGGQFDLVVLGEIGYYLSLPRLERLGGLAAASLEPAGSLLAVHWRPLVEHCELTGDGVHAVLRRLPGLRLLAHYEEEQFVADVFERQPGLGLPRP